MAKETTSDFEERFSKMTSSAFSVLSIALGSRLGLFDILGKMDGPRTPQEIADAGGFKLRYVQEWLGAMVCEDIMDVDTTGSEDRYSLPKHRLPVLTGSGSPAVFTWSLACIAAANEELIKCFYKDGPPGIPYSSFPYFHEWREQRMKANSTTEFLHHHNDLIPGLTDTLTKGARVLGIGSSSGILELLFARHFPNSTFLGTDISEAAIKTANAAATEQNLSNVSFLVKDIYDMPSDWTERYDVIIGNDVIHDLPRPCDALKELRRVLKTNGIISIMDVYGHSRIADNRSVPRAGLYYTLSLYHCMAVSLAVDGGEGAGNMWGREKAVATFQEAGFKEVLEPDPGVAHYVCVKK